MSKSIIIEMTEYIPVRDFANLLNVSSQSVLNWINTHRIEGIKTGSRYWVPLNAINIVRKKV